MKSLSELPPLSEIRDLVEAGEDRTDSEDQQMDEGSEEAAEIIDGSRSNLSTLESSTEIGNNGRDGAQIVHLTLADK